MIPVFLVFYVLTDTHQWIAGVLFAAASITDWLDGFVARKFKTTTRFGSFLDPVADKLAVIIALFWLVGEYGSLWFTLPSLFIIARELVISSLRQWMAEARVSSVVEVDVVAKLKTGMQMLAIVILLSNPPIMTRPWVIIGVVLLYGAAVLTVWSMIRYFRVAWPVLKAGFFEKPQ